MFAQASRRAAEARFKQRDRDAEGQEIDVRKGKSALWVLDTFFSPCPSPSLFSFSSLM